MESVIENLGVFLYPQLALSLLTVGLVGGYLIAWFRGELYDGEQPWRRTLVPLSGLAVGIGLLGSVVGFCQAFGGFEESLDINRLSGSLSLAYFTTGAGLLTSLVGGLGSYVLDLVAGGKH
jgi:MotA/TolQ/ExbB proton channel family